MSYFSSIYAADLPSRAKMVYLYLFDRADKEGYCFPAINTIAKDLSLSRSTVKRAIQDLEQHGYIEKNNDTGKTVESPACCIKCYRGESDHLLNRGMGRDERRRLISQ